MTVLSYYTLKTRHRKTDMAKLIDISFAIFVANARPKSLTVIKDYILDVKFEFYSQQNLRRGLQNEIAGNIFATGNMSFLLL